MAQNRSVITVEHKVAPGPKGYPLIGNLPDRRKSPIGFFLDAAKKYGDVVRIQFGSRTIHLFCNPEHIKHILQDNNKNYGRQTRGYTKMRTVVGNGLITSEGSFWLRQRRIAQPAFHRQRIASFATNIVGATEDMLVNWESYKKSRKPFNVAAEMMKLTLRIVGETLLGTDVSKDANIVGEAITIGLHHINDSLNNIFSIPEIIPTPKNRRFRNAIKILDNVVLGMIAERRKKGIDTGDLLSMLIMARDEDTGESMNDQQLRDEVLTIFLAGHETTANALSWTWYLLSRNPDVRSRIQMELKDVLNGRAPSFEDLSKLRYTMMTIKESMRLYPPAWIFARSAIEDDLIGGYHIPAHSIVLVSPYITHRHSELWDNPESFDPDRFSTERVAKLPRFAYFPFGGGPHLCIGNEFALMEAQLILAVVMQNYSLDLLPGHVVEMDPLITLRPKNGLMMTVA
jgi:cytochrome P450